MKSIIPFTFLFLFFTGFTLKASDSIFKQQRFFITTYPSNLFVGDLSLGSEYAFKRVGAQLIYIKKLFDTKFIPLFDKGFRVTGYLKYKIVHKSKFSLNADVGYSYRREYFENKDVPLILISSFRNSANDEKSIYNQSQSNLYYGFSFGTSAQIKIIKNFSLGWNLNIDILKVERKLQINYFVSGEELRNTNYWSETISKDFPSTRIRSYKNWINPNLLIKLIYEL